MLAAGLVCAQPGRIQLSADAALTTCEITDVSGLKTIYIYHINTSGATASQFMVQVDAGVTMSYLSESSLYLKIGTCAGPLATGCAIAYQTCLTGPIQILTLQYFASGTSTPCSEFNIVEDPGAIVPGLYVTDCANPPNLLTGLSSKAVVNNDGSCPCSIVPVESTSWGQIKAIYH